MAAVCGIVDSILEKHDYPGALWLYDDNHPGDNPSINGLVTFLNAHHRIITPRPSRCPANIGLQGLFHFSSTRVTTQLTRLTGYPYRVQTNKSTCMPLHHDPMPLTMPCKHWFAGLFSFLTHSCNKSTNHLMLQNDANEQCNGMTQQNNTTEQRNDAMERCDGCLVHA
jgi:hypothetical protein